MRIAVTGATGLLGRHLVRHFAAAGHQLRCWHRPGSDRTGFEPHAEAIDWMPGTLGDEEAARSLVAGVDGVVHGAVQWLGPRNRGAGMHGDANLFTGVNLIGSLQLLQAAWEAQVPRFVFVSSGAVHEVILPDRPLDEDHPLRPRNLYGAYKAAVENFVHAFGLGQGRAFCTLRPTGIYGLDHPPLRSRWYDLVGQVLRGETVDSSRGGKEVHAADVARAAEVLLHADPERVAGQTFNCFDRYVAEEEVARIARDLSGSTSEIASRNPVPKHLIDTAKIRALGMTFGGDPLLRRTIAELIEAHRKSRP